MPTTEECICCCEIDQVMEKKQGTRDLDNRTCFEPVCLNVHVLQAAYFAYRLRYREIQVEIHELVASYNYSF